MYINGKRYLLKLLQEWGRGRIKENDGGGKFNYDIFDIFVIYQRTFINATMYFHPAQQFKKSSIKKKMTSGATQKRQRKDKFNLVK
jgi:hypothetical protein